MGVGRKHGDTHSLDNRNSSVSSTVSSSLKNTNKRHAQTSVCTAYGDGALLTSAGQKPTQTFKRLRLLSPC